MMNRWPILNVESFTHWVWVAGVDENEFSEKNDPNLGDPINGIANQYSVTVSFTESGTSIHNVPHPDWWPSTGTYLPWMQDYSWIDDAHTNMRSSTKMVWYWQQYTQYNPSNPQQHPDIYTKYYDGSG